MLGDGEQGSRGDGEQGSRGAEEILIFCVSVRIFLCFIDK